MFLQCVFKGSKLAAKMISWTGYTMIIFMVLITFINVVGRFGFAKAIPDSLELIELTMGVLCGSAIFHATLYEGHVVVDLFLSKFSRRTQIIIDSVGSFLAFAVWAVLAPRIYLLGINSLEHSVHTPLIRIPIGIFISILGVELFFCCLVSLTKIRPYPLLKKEPGI